MTQKFGSVDEYIAAQPAEAQAVLKELRVVVLGAAPGVSESIRYDIPSYRLDGRPLISFGAWKHHIGLYPVHALDEALEGDVAPLRSAKSTVKLALSAPFPRALVTRVLAAVVDRNVRLTRARG